MPQHSVAVRMGSDAHERADTEQPDWIRTMKAERCPVERCGAVVVRLPSEDGEIVVDPRPMDVVVPAAAGESLRYTIVTGFRPHWMTCVDVTERSHHRKS